MGDKKSTDHLSATCREFSEDSVPSSYGEPPCGLAAEVPPTLEELRGGTDSDLLPRRCRKQLGEMKEPGRGLGSCPLVSTTRSARVCCNPYD